ncbi:MAG: tetratricopeptide repeat protein [Candidatus Aureabacteria bacterium]|nr:tetratricopeptide repeat protein [Candidatus Auribacterota bacterium]
MIAIKAVFQKERKKDSLAALLIFFVILSLYFVSLPYPFLWDDEVSLTQNPGFGTPRYVREIFTKHFFDAGLQQKFSPQRGFYRPLVGLSFLLDRLIWGMQAYGFRLTNIILHAATCIAFYFLFKRLNFSPGISFLCTFIYAVHPVHIGSVAYVSGRTDVLRTLFMLLAFLSYWDRKLLPSFVFSVCAFLSKEDAVVLPGLFFASDIILKKKFSKTVIPYLLLIPAYMLFRRYYLNAHDLHGMKTSFFYYATLAKSVFVYLRIIVFPFDLHFERFHPIVTSFVSGAYYILAFFVLFFLALKISWNRPVALFSLISFGVVFLPVSNIVPIYYRYSDVYLFLSDHFLYMPLMFIILFTLSLMPPLKIITRTFVLASYIVLCAFFLFFFATSIRVWRDKEIFYKDIIKKSAFPFRAYNNLAAYFEKRGDSRCLEYLKKLKKIMPPDYVYYYIVKTHWHYFQEHDLEKTIQTFEEAIGNGVRVPLVYYGLGDVWFEKGDVQKAINYYEEGLRLSSTSDADALFRLGFLYYCQGDRISLEKALGYFVKSNDLNRSETAERYMIKTKKLLFLER